MYQLHLNNLAIINPAWPSTSIPSLLLTAYHTVLLHTLIFTELVNAFPTFYKMQLFITVLQDSATDPCHESHQFSLQPYTLFKIFLILSIHLYPKFLHTRLSL